MNMKLNPDEMIDYFAAQAPGGGQRGLASLLLLDWFETDTGLPAHQLFPYIIASSVGITLTSALWLRHPEHPNAARMSARQLIEIFPEIASRVPKKIAIFANKNSRQPFADAIELFVGDSRLKDLLGTVFFSAHEIGGVSSSYKLFAKTINPFTGEISYTADPETRILDIALAGTALPSVFPSFRGLIDLAFAETLGEPLQSIHDLFPNSAKGAFIRVGNFRSQEEKSRDHLHSAGFLLQAITGSIFDAIADHIYAQTIGHAKKLFKGRVFNLEQEIPKGYTNPPTVKANVTTPEQFAKVRAMTEAYIANNLDTLIPLASTLKSAALARMANHPETAFGIPPEIQEFPLPEIPKPTPAPVSENSYAFGYAAGRLTKGLAEFTVRAAQSPALQKKVTQGRLKFGEAVDQATDILLPPRP